MKDKQDEAKNLVLSISTTGINMNAPGTYSIHYRVTDSMGLFAEAVRTIVVVAPDPEPSGPVELEFTISDEDQGEAVVNVDNSDDTDGVNLLNFTIEVTEGDFDVTIESLPIQLEASALVSDIASSVHLFVDGEEVGSENINPSGEVSMIEFSDLDIFIPTGESVEFEIQADIHSVPNGSFDEGDVLKASITSSGVDSVEAVKEDGTPVLPEELDGAVFGENKIFYTEGLVAEFVSSHAEVSFDGDGEFSDIGTFTIEFDAIAFGNDVYLDKNCTVDNDGNFSVGTNSFSMLNSANLTFLGCDLSSTADLEANSFLVGEDETQQFTLTVSVSPTSDTFTQIILESLSWADTDVSGTELFTFGLGDDSDFETPVLFLNSV